MKIRITQTVEVDPDKWAEEYGIAKEDVRDDVKSYFQVNSLQTRVEELGLNPSNKWIIRDAVGRQGSC